MAKRRMKGFLPLGGFSFNQNNIAYKKQGINNRPLIDSTIDDKETQVVINPTGGSFNVVFTKASIYNFLLQIGDNDYIKKEKDKIFVELSKDKTTNIKTPLQVSLIVGDKEWDKLVNGILSKIYISFELKDSLDSVYGLSSKRPRYIPDDNYNDVAHAQMDDSLVSGKSGFNANDIVFLTFVESTPIGEKIHKCTYNSAVFRAANEGIFTITSINLVDSTTYS